MHIFPKHNIGFRRKFYILCRSHNTSTGLVHETLATYFFHNIILSADYRHEITFIFSSNDCDLALFCNTTQFDRDILGQVYAPDRIVGVGGSSTLYDFSIELDFNFTVKQNKYTFKRQVIFKFHICGNLKDTKIHHHLTILAV